MKLKAVSSRGQGLETPIMPHYNFNSIFNKNTSTVHAFLHSHYTAFLVNYAQELLIRLIESSYFSRPQELLGTHLLSKSASRLSYTADLALPSRALSIYSWGTGDQWVRGSIFERVWSSFSVDVASTGYVWTPISLLVVS